MSDFYIHLSIIMFVWFTIGWLQSKKEDKYAWIDFYWVASLGLAVIYIGLTYDNLTSNPPLMLLMAMYSFWAVRLGSFLFGRIRKHDEDRRYIDIKNKWGKNTARNFYFLFLVEALLNLALVLPLYFLVKSEPTELSTFHIVGFLLFVLLIAMESLADKQLSQFIKENPKRDKVCEKGLWYYSRHPNYFFEIMIWYSYAVYTVNLSYWNILPAILMTLLIWKVTGVPPAEEQSLKSKKEKYIKYQQQTSVLIPWFKNKG